MVKPPGTAVSAPPELRIAVTKVCGTRRVQPGKFTALLREKFALDSLQADERRKARMQADLDRKARAQIKKEINSIM